MKSTDGQESPWQVDTLRATVFVQAPAPAPTSAGEWWKQLTEDEAALEVLESRPAIGVDRAVGKSGDGKLSLLLRGAKFDLLWNFAESHFSTGEPAQLPALSEAVPLFRELAARWLTGPDFPPIARVAFGAILQQGVESRRTGYELLKSYLPDVNIDPVGSTDLLYQINRRRQSKAIKEIQLNRLSKWYVASIHAFMVSSLGKTSALEKSEYCRLELDLSTPAERDEALEPKAVSPLFEELIALGLEISETGDHV